MKDGFWWQPKKSSTFWFLMCTLPSTNAIWWKRPWALKAVWNNKGRIWEPIWLDKHCSTSYISLKMLSWPVIDLAPLVAMKIRHICMQLPYIKVKLDCFPTTMKKSPCHRHCETLMYMYSSTYSDEIPAKKEKTLHTGGIFILYLPWTLCDTTYHSFCPTLVDILSMLLWIWTFTKFSIVSGKLLTEFLEATFFFFFFLLHEEVCKTHAKKV